MNIISLFSGCGGLDLGFERAGFNIKIIEGDYTNIKVTTPEDIDIVKIFLKKDK